jgi:hypothetical protein
MEARRYLRDIGNKVILKLVAVCVDADKCNDGVSESVVSNRSSNSESLSSRRFVFDMCWIQCQGDRLCFSNRDGVNVNNSISCGDIPLHSSLNYSGKWIIAFFIHKIIFHSGWE